MGKIRLMSDDIRDIVYEDVRDDVLADVTEADVIPLVQHYTQLVGDDKEFRDAVEYAATWGKDEETFLKAICIGYHPPSTAVGPFLAVLREAAVRVVQRMWPKVQHSLEPLNESERLNTFEEVVLSVQGQLVTFLNAPVHC